MEWLQAIGWTVLILMVSHGWGRIKDGLADIKAIRISVESIDYKLQDIRGLRD